MSARSRTIWLFAWRERDTLCVIPLVLLAPTVPQPVKTGFILSCSPLLFGVSPPLLPTGSFESAPRCRGLCPLRDITVRSPLAREIPLSRYVPSSGFLNPSTDCSTARLRGLVASRCHVQGSRRSGVSPALQPTPARRRVVPPCRCRPAAHRRSRLPRRNLSTSRPCSATRCVPPGRRIRSALRSLPSSGFVLPRVFAFHREPGSPCSPPVTFAIPVFSAAV